MRTPERTVPVGDPGAPVDLCVQTFGPADAPPLLLLGNTMLTWHDDLCARLADGPRLVVRHDLRGTGRSPAAPGYTLRDLAGDAAGLLDAFGIAGAHVAGFGVGGFVAQILALDHPSRVATLTLAGTRPNAPGPVDADLPDHSPALLAELGALGQPDWADRDAVVAYMVEGGRAMAGDGPYDAEAVRDQARRIADRAEPGPAAMARDQIAVAFAEIDCTPRWRERLGEITAPTLVLHGVDDRFFPFGNGEALAREIPDARLVALPGTGQELARRVWDTVVAELLAHTA